MKKRFLSLVMGMMIVTSVVTGCGSKSQMAASSDAGCYVEYSNSEPAAAADYARFEDCEVESEEAFDSNDAYGISFAASDDVAGASAAKDGSMDVSSFSDIDVPNAATTIAAEDKLVYTADITIETLDFDQTYNQLTALVRENGGRIESEDYDAKYTSYTNDPRYRSGYHVTRMDYLTVRIPSANYNAFMEADSTLGNITNKTQSLTNISQQYYSTTTRVDLLQGQKEYYMHQLELIEQQLMDCEDYEYVIDQMVDLEDRIIAVQNEINALSGTVKTMDMNVAYSTINIRLEEVKEYTDITPVVEEEDDTFFTRLKASLKGSLNAVLSFLEGVLTVLIYILPFVLIFGAVTFGIIALIKNAIKKSKAKKAKKASENALVTQANNSKE